MLKGRGKGEGSKDDKDFRARAAACTKCKRRTKYGEREEGREGKDEISSRGGRDGGEGSEEGRKEGRALNWKNKLKALGRGFEIERGRGREGRDDGWSTFAL